MGLRISDQGLRNGYGEWVGQKRHQPVNHISPAVNKTARDYPQTGNSDIETKENGSVWQLKSFSLC